MPSFTAVVAILSLVGTLAAGIAAYRAAEFFDQLVIRHPELAGAFPRPSVFTRYGPIRPSYMSYLKSKLHLQLPEPELRRAGARVLTFLYVHAVLFVALVLSGLWWGYQNGA